MAGDAPDAASTPGATRPRKQGIGRLRHILPPNPGKPEPLTSWYVMQCSECGKKIIAAQYFPLADFGGHYWYTTKKHKRHWCPGGKRRIHLVVTTQKDLARALMDRLVSPSSKWPLIEFRPAPGESPLP